VVSTSTDWAMVCDTAAVSLAERLGGAMSQAASLYS
jgi:hypothetical protein